MSLVIGFTEDEGGRRLRIEATIKDRAEAEMLILRLSCAAALLEDAALRLAIATPREPEPLEAKPAEERPPTPRPAPVPSASDRSQAMRRIVTEMWPTWATQGEIAAKLGVTHGRVYQIARELGLPSRGKDWFGQRVRALRGEEPAPLAKRDPASRPETEQPKEYDPDPGAEIVPAPPPPPPLSRPPPASPEPAVVPNTSPTAIPDCELVEDEIRHGGKSLPITPRQHAVLRVLLAAAPAPVSTTDVLKRAFTHMRSVDALAHLMPVKNDLTHGLPRIGLVFREIKGVGLAVQEAA